MQTNTIREKKLTRMRTKQPAWYGIAAIGMISLSLTACASPGKLRKQAADLEERGRYSEAVAIL